MTEYSLSDRLLDRRRLLVGAACAAASPLAGCDVTGANVAVVRFKVIARARVDGVDYEGAAVNEMRAHYTPHSLSRFMMSRTFKMESTVVDLGRRDALFVLLTDYLIAIGLLWGVPVAGSADKTTIPGLKHLEGRREYPLHTPDVRTLDQTFPRIAAFRDEADPTSVYEVDPRHMERTHGPGARFLGLSIEIVDRKTPLTNEIEQRLGWLDLSSNRSLLQPPAYWSDESAVLGRRIIPRSFKSRN